MADENLASKAPALKPLSPSAWRTDSPPYGKRPIWQYVWLQGECEHSGEFWFRQGWGTAGIRTNDAEDGLLGYRSADIERICKDNDIDLWSAKLVGWLPMVPPALLMETERAALEPCDDGEWAKTAVYRGYTIRHGNTVFAKYHFAHPDYDGAPDGNDDRCGTGDTMEACWAEIDALCEARGETE